MSSNECQSIPLNIAVDSIVCSGSPADEGCELPGVGRRMEKEGEKEVAACAICTVLKAYVVLSFPLLVVLHYEF